MKCLEPRSSPFARVDFTMADTDNGNVLRNSKLSPNVHLDWSLDGNSGPFVVERSTSFSFSNPRSLGSPQSGKTFDDGVLTDGTNYAYRIYKRSLTDTLYFYHADHLGTPIAMTNTSGNFVWRAEHTPFGGIYALTVSTISNNLRFTGQYFDGETGLAQNWFRDYRSVIGRYWEPDPINKVRPTNYDYGQNDPIIRSYSRRLKVQLPVFWKTVPYTYALNSPIQATDPTGLDTWVGATYGAGFFAGLGGLSYSSGVMENLSTGEVCHIRMWCWHVGIGLALSGGVSGGFSYRGPHCGYGLNGIMQGIGFGSPIVSGSGVSDQGNPPDERGGSSSVGTPEIGGHMGYQGCNTEVMQCWNKPCRCQ